MEDTTKAAPAVAEEDDDDIDLFGSDEEEVNSDTFQSFDRIAGHMMFFDTIFRLMLWLTLFITENQFVVNIQWFAGCANLI